MRRAKLLDSGPTSLTTGSVPVRSDVFIHNLDPFTLAHLTMRAQKLTRVISLLRR
jgi:hypothetical protein